MIAGRSAKRYGEAKNSWLTGTAAWAFVNISQAILGIHPDFDGLRIHPCLPKEITSYRVTRRYRGTVYHILVRRAEEGEFPGVTMDGQPMKNGLIPHREGLTNCSIEAIVK